MQSSPAIAQETGYAMAAPRIADVGGMAYTTRNSPDLYKLTEPAQKNALQTVHCLALTHDRAGVLICVIPTAAFQR